MYRSIRTNTDLLTATQDASKSTHEVTQTDDLLDPSDDNTAHSTSTASSGKEDDSEMNKDTSKKKLSTEKKCCYTECPKCGTFVLDIGRHLKKIHQEKSIHTSQIRKFDSNIGSKGRVTAGTTHSFVSLEDPPPDLQSVYDKLSGRDLKAFKKYAHACLVVEKADSSALLSNPALLEAYTKSLSDAEVGPSGVAQVMATIQRSLIKIKTQNSTKNALK